MESSWKRIIKEKINKKIRKRLQREMEQKTNSIAIKDSKRRMKECIGNAME